MNKINLDTLLALKFIEEMWGSLCVKVEFEQDEHYWQANVRNAGDELIFQTSWGAGIPTLIDDCRNHLLGTGAQ